MVALVLMMLALGAIIEFEYQRPTIETKRRVYVVPWPWKLEWDGNGFIMRLEVKE
ncbi:hypothetical protein SAMN04488579_10291 [Eubacterium barkeri]|uniref:Uncharacterized protein n=1 Tax=Eubacterium barkeri TaxID=1528 RepID=A0A1H3BI75_EUBBA|nr:hypothetical protein SAMN04488579_10291 [Eubacterium barkeri]